MNEIPLEKREFKDSEKFEKKILKQEKRIKELEDLGKELKRELEKKITFTCLTKA